MLELLTMGVKRDGWHGLSPTGHRTAQAHAHTVLACFPTEAGAIASSSPGEPIEPLTPREQEVLRLLADGASNREIAEQMSMSVHTVAYHLRQLEKRFDALNRVQLAYIAGRILDD